MHQKGDQVHGPSPACRSPSLATAIGHGCFRAAVAGFRSHGDLAKENLVLSDQKLEDSPLEYYMESWKIGYNQYIHSSGIIRQILI